MTDLNDVSTMKGSGCPTTSSGGVRSPAAPPKPSRVYFKWTPAAEKKLIEGWYSRKPLIEIASEIGISEASARHKAKHLKLQYRARIYRDPAALRYLETWTAEEIDQLKEYWVIGYTVSEIGRRMKKTKSAIAGKVRRLNLSRRRETPVLHTVELGHSLVTLPTDGCRWPFGDPKADDFHFCGDPVIRDNDGKLRPYCAAHCAKAYVPVKRKPGVPFELHGWKVAAE